MLRLHMENQPLGKRVKPREGLPDGASLRTGEARRKIAAPQESIARGKSMLRTSFVHAAVVGLTVITLGSAANAAMIFPGTSAFITGEPGPVPAGANLLATMTSPVTGVAFSGSITTNVYNADPSNPLGGLTFTYTITNDISSLDHISRFTVNSFTSFLTDVAYEIPAGGNLPAIVSRSSGAGDVIGFDFMVPPFGPGELPPGSTAATLVIQTNGVQYAVGSASLIDGSVGTATTFVPGGVGNFVPEPASLSLVAVGAATLLLRRRKQH
jgi:hypothetical protein